MDSDFAAAYIDGKEEEFDVIKDYQAVVDGSISVWNNLMDLANNGCNPVVWESGPDADNTILIAEDEDCK